MNVFSDYHSVWYESIVFNLQIISTFCQNPIDWQHGVQALRTPPTSLTVITFIIDDQLIGLLKFVSDVFVWDVCLNIDVAESDSKALQTPYETLIALNPLSLPKYLYLCIMYITQSYIFTCQAAYFWPWFDLISVKDNALNHFGSFYLQRSARFDE